MSQIPPVSAAAAAASSSSGPADDAPAVEGRSSFDRKRPYVADEDESSDGREDTVRSSRPRTWHYPSAPVEPPLKPTQLRSIGVDSILNPPSQATPSTREQAMGEQQTSTAGPSHQRLPSSPSVRLPSPSLHHAKRLSLSPGSHHHPMIQPASPSARFVSATGGVYPRKTSAPQSPLIQASRPGSNTGAQQHPHPHPGSPGGATVDPVASGQPFRAPAHHHHHQAPGGSVQSTPTFHSHSRRTSANPTPNLSPQETSPTTPMSALTQFGRASPALATASASAPQSTPFSPYTTVEPSSTRLPSVVAGPPRQGDEPPSSSSSSAAAAGFSKKSQTESTSLPGLIPCVLDLKSGSSSQAEKRKANSDASRRFRNRKRNELQMEQKIAAQQDEMRKQADALHQQAQDLRSLLHDRDHYRSERDFYRDQLRRLVPQAKIPARPPSPSSPQMAQGYRVSASASASLEHGAADAMRTRTRTPVDNNTPAGAAGPPAHMGATATATGLPPPAAIPRSPARPAAGAGAGGNWSVASPPYATSPVPGAERTIPSEEQQAARSLAQYPGGGAWSRA